MKMKVVFSLIISLVLLLTSLPSASASVTTPNVEKALNFFVEDGKNSGLDYILYDKKDDSFGEIREHAC